SLAEQCSLPARHAVDACLERLRWLVKRAAVVAEVPACTWNPHVVREGGVLLAILRLRQPPERVAHREPPLCHRLALVLEPADGGRELPGSRRLREPVLGPVR